MHMRRQLRKALVEALVGIDGVRVLASHRVAFGVALAEEGETAVLVYPVADLEPQRINTAVQGPRPTWRGFAFGIATFCGDEDAEDGRLDEVTEEIERRLFALDTPLRALANRDIVSRGGDVAVVDTSDRAVALVTVVELHCGMLEGVPDQRF